MSDPYAFTSTSAWALNIVSSVGIILANKEIMSAFNFRFPTTLVSIHLASTALIGAIVSFASSSDNKAVLVPLWELIGFSLISNGSLISMNISLMLNTVGFYQISKLSVIPATCALEWLLHGRTFSREVKLSTSVVMIGVGICTGSTLRVNNIPGLVAAAIAVFCTAMQQSLIGSLQRKHRLGSFPLLAQTASVQALSLLPFGPVVDYLLSHTAVTDYQLRPHAALFIALSCILAMGCNLSQYLCINKSSAVTFQVLGTVKTILVIVLGALIFESPVSVRNVIGMGIALGGMVMYSWAVERSKEGDRGKEGEKVEASLGSKLMMSPLPSYVMDVVKGGGEEGASKSSLAA